MTPAGAGRKMRVLVLYGILVAAFLVLVPEGVIRLLGLQGPSYIRPDSRLGWAHIPGRSGLYVSPQARAHFRIDSLGLVGPERSLQKQPGEKRLLLLGDSFTESMQVPYDSSWACLLERRLGPPWQVLNAGVSGYGTDNALLYLRRNGPRLKPDAVFLLFFTGNDVSDNDHELSLKTGQSLAKPYFVLAGDSLRLVGDPAPAPHRGLGRFLPRQVWESSRLYLFLRTHLYEWRALRREKGATGDHLPLPWEVYRRVPTAEWERAWNVTAGLMHELKREADHQGIPLAVGILPTGWRIEQSEREDLFRQHPTLADSTTWDFAGPDRRLAGILTLEGIPCVRLAGPLQEAARRTGSGLYGDHLTARGHRVVAEAVARMLEPLVGAAAPASAITHEGPP
jgi:lysophospholipase L1-like esterase